MDEIQTRLQETSQKCLVSYAEWVGKKRDPKAQETLQVAIHELRKVASRLEIDLAVSERDQMAARHIPIPSHRSVKDGVDADFEDDGQDFGNSDNSHSRPQQMQQGGGGGQPRRRLPHQRKPGGGGHQGGGQPNHQG